MREALGLRSGPQLAQLWLTELQVLCRWCKLPEIHCYQESCLQGDVSLEAPTIKLSSVDGRRICRLMGTGGAGEWRSQVLESR